MRDDSSELRSDQPQFLSAAAQSMELLDRRLAAPSQLLKAEMA